MKINCLITFLDGKDRYETGDQRVVSDANGARFCALGWAVEVGSATTVVVPTAPSSTTLDVKNTVVGSTAKTK